MDCPPRPAYTSSYHSSLSHGDDLSSPLVAVVNDDASVTRALTGLLQSADLHKRRWP